jgi:hypothetical protein
MTSLGHETRQRWNSESVWIWPAETVHERLLTPELFTERSGRPAPVDSERSTASHGQPGDRTRCGSHRQRPSAANRDRTLPADASQLRAAARRSRAALEAGTDPTVVAQWTSEVQAEQARAKRDLQRAQDATGRRRAATS